MPIQTAADSISNSAGSPYGFKNRIINGAMVIDQRNGGSTVSSHLSFPVDRMQMVKDTSSGTFTIGQSNTVPPGFTKSVVFTVGTAYTPSSSENNFLKHIIEGYNVADLDWGLSTAKTVTLSFWVRSSVTGTFGGSLRNGSANRSYVFTYTINQANTWEYETITVPGDTSGTWLTTNGNGLEISWGLSVGSTYSNTVGGWYAGNYISATSATQITSTAGATWHITGVQVEKGSTATSFDYRPFGTELQLCQRYFERSYDYGENTYSGEIMKGIASFGSPHISAGASTNQMVAYMKLFLVPKRTQPTMTGYSLTNGVAGKWRRYYTGVSPADDQNVTFNNISTTGAEVNVASGGNCNVVLGHWIASAEL